ncbi:MAG TPA: family 16 glycosylhydrolase [Polyangiaceae bacterium]|nr:family 16 glycosylhydrolase [Polyangiaceae bacterium]
MISWRARIAAFLAVAVAPATAGAVASAELYHSQSYRYGRFEARIRFAAGDGVISSFFLWKVGSEVSGAYWNELDFEKLGADCRMQTNTLYGNPMKSGEQVGTMPADMCTAYHDYGFEWTPTYIAWFIDAQEIRRETGAVAAAFADNASEGMRMHFNVWPGNANFGGNFNPSILPVRQFISWVQYSSYQNGTFKLEWRQDFDGAGVPSGWATGSWASPLNLSTHQPQNVTFSNGIAVLSLTADNATGFTGTPPADSAGGTTGRGGASAGGSSGSGGSSAGTSTGGVAGGAGGRPATTGGATTGGKATGGAATGGATAGGTNTGGAASGGAMVGGTNTGGAATGGVTMGGATTGGATMGGATTGGTATGGATTGGTTGGVVSNSSGGVTSGGAPASGGAISTGGQAPPQDSGDSSGCGCQLKASPSPYGFGAFGLAMLTALASRRRGRAARKPREPRPLV